MITSRSDVDSPRRHRDTLTIKNTDPSPRNVMSHMDGLSDCREARSTLYVQVECIDMKLAVDLEPELPQEWKLFF